MTEPEPQKRGIRPYTEADPLGEATQQRARPSQPLPELTAAVEERVTFDPAHRGLTDGLPQGAALLCVTADYVRSLFKLNWFFEGMLDESRPDDVETHLLPPFTMSGILNPGKQNGSDHWEKSHDSVLSWWATKDRLSIWLKMLLDAVRHERHSPVRLVVWDNTGFQIPWELMYSDDAGVWVGAEVEVIRWTSIHKIGRVARYTAEAALCRGGVLALETEDIFGPDGPMLDSPLRRYGSVAKRTMWQLLAALDDTRQELGLVLVRCHGIYGETAAEFELAGMRMTSYGRFRMFALGRSPAIVFLNACDTASHAMAGKHSFVAASSFAELFLRRGAYGVLATLGQIDWDYSHEFAVRLLAAGRDEQCLATLLLAYRRVGATRAQRRTGDADGDLLDEDDFKAFFQSFAYVYFGHPDTRLQLISREPGDRQ